MLKPASGFKGLTIAAVDGDLGSVKDLYFDDLTWTVRYLVVDTGGWLPGRQVLISPMSVLTPDAAYYGAKATRARNTGSSSTRPVPRTTQVSGSGLTATDSSVA